MAVKSSDRNRFTKKMQKKLALLFGIIVLAFVGLGVRLTLIVRDNGNQYKKQVLSQQQYDSTILPYKRGSILDRNGSILASSEKVYNVILDSVAISADEAYLEPTLAALREDLSLDTNAIRNYIAEHKNTSRYRVLAKKRTYEEIEHLRELVNDPDSLVRGIWFEEEYTRVYPEGSLACDLIGFTSSDNRGTYGLEEFYNDDLSGTNGREYGYLDEDSNLERTTVFAVDGNIIQTTIDANVQAIVEKYLKKFNDQYQDNFREGNGANNVGCIIMDVNTGEILAMASYPNFDLNNTRDTSRLIGMPMLDENGKKTGEIINAENVGTLEGEAYFQNLNALWKNFCINDTYEPGSVSKPFTVAAAIESGSITGNESYNCEGKLHVGDYDIACHNTYGDGYLTVTEGIERSCNVCMMYVAMATGVSVFTKFQHTFGFGLKTNIDLAGEPRTDSLIYTAKNMGITDLATNSFGQTYNCTMIQMITAFCSLINGGYYYEPHVVRKIVSPTGATVQNIEPRVLRQTISESTSERVREMCNTVVTGEHGTGKTARPAGYMIGGKTGTAETLPRGNNEYVVSFMGYAPADNPQIAIYVVVDRPNVRYQDDAKFATRIVRNILTEVLPYLGIYMTEELSDKEKQELEELQLEITTPVIVEEFNVDTDGDGIMDAVADVDTDGDGVLDAVANLDTDGDGVMDAVATIDTDGDGIPDSATELKPGVVNPKDVEKKDEIWKSFPIDPETGYAVDPSTGNFVDPDTGAVIGYSYDLNHDPVEDMETVETTDATQEGEN